MARLLLVVFSPLLVPLAFLANLISYALLWMLAKIAGPQDEDEDEERCADTRPVEGHV
jgi:hypothetical protein